MSLNKLVQKYDLKIKGIIHGGAHHAEESDMYQSIGVQDVIWIEANPEKCIVSENKVQHLPGNKVINSAVLDVSDVEVTFNITNNGESSSILKLKDHKRFYPNINVVDTITVKTKTIKKLFEDEQLDITKYNFVNLDLQGIELRALKSLESYIDHIDYIYTEVNRSDLYENCDRIEQLDEFLKDKGFHRFETEWTHADWGDALYIRLPKLKVVVTSYNNEDWTETNIDAIVNQTYTNYEVLFVDDASSDTTFEIAEYLVGTNDKFKLIKHTENKTKAYTFTEHLPAFVNDDDVVLFVDGDDWISHHDVFEYVAKYYVQHKSWVAYSKFIHYPSLTETEVHGRPHPDTIIRFNLFRQYPFIASHLKTMKGFLLKKINKEDFKFQGNYVRFADDVALMYAALEMAPSDRIGVMNVVAYVYNESQSNKERNNEDMRRGQEGEVHIRSIHPYSVIKNNSDKVVSPRMLGRLANQMFEIAAAYSFALDNGCQMVVSEYNGVFSSKTGEVSSPRKYERTMFRNVNFVDTLPKCDVWKESSFEYKPLSYKFDDNLYLEGQFQSEKYFSHNRDRILELFAPSDTTKKYIENKYGLYFKNSLSIHIRRGDYTMLQDFHPICTMEYYQTALQHITSQHQIENILIVTDDIVWVKEQFNDPRIVFVEGEQDYIDLHIMSYCTHNIIANSSFSWWGAWLNTNPNKTVVAPRDWFGPSLTHNTKDLIPQGWVIL